MYSCIIGLGQGGCAIATKFSDIGNYSIIRIDSDIQETPKDNSIDIQIATQARAEDYENNFPNLRKNFELLSGKVLFVVAGSGNISLGSLALLEQIKEKCNIEVLYVKPDVEFLGAEGKLKEKAVFNVFQEYARSGLFERLYIVSNTAIEEAMGGVSIISYYDKINQSIVQALYLLDKFQELKPVTSTMSNLPIGTRISTFGLLNLETRQESMFFELDTPTDSMYYFAYNESVLKENVDLLKDIKSFVKYKMESGIARVSYGIYATNYDNAIAICASHTSLIQK